MIKRKHTTKHKRYAKIFNKVSKKVDKFEIGNEFWSMLELGEN